MSDSDTVSRRTREAVEMVANDSARALAWLSRNPQCEVSFQQWEEDGCWQVHAVAGGRNDREWRLIGEGDTPLAAICDAMKGKKR